MSDDQALRSVRDVLERVVAGHRGPLTSQERRRLIDDADAAIRDLDEYLDRPPASPVSSVSAASPASPVVPPASASPPSGAAQPASAPAVAWLDGVAAAHASLEEGRRRLQGSVDDARAGGASWRQIGETLGVTPQSAHKRFDPAARRRHADYMRERSRRPIP